MFAMLEPDLQSQCFSALAKSSMKAMLLKQDRILPNVTIDRVRSLRLNTTRRRLRHPY
jgi:hypothetical protein